jgi:hypothetical protein
MQLYNVPTGIDRQIEDLIKEEVLSAEMAAKGYLELYLASQERIIRLNNALKISDCTVGELHLRLFFVC